MGKLKLFILLFVLAGVDRLCGIMERGDYPWGVRVRSFYDTEQRDALGGQGWLLNLGPTGIRGRIYPSQADQIVVKFVFQDNQSPARGLVQVGDIVVGANGKKFTTSHRFGRNLPGGGGWDGPMMELAKHIEDSQGGDGRLRLMILPGGSGAMKTVTIQLRRVGRFAPTFPYDCPRSKRMLEELCDFLVMDYRSANWKKANEFYGSHHGHAHQLLALMGSGLSKYDEIIRENIEKYYRRSYDPKSGGFQMWQWGFDSIVMGEYYLKTRDERLRPIMEALAKAMPEGCHNGNGIYTHRSEIHIRRAGRKPYASIAAISGLHMVGMSLFREAGVGVDDRLYHNIHQHYLNSSRPNVLNIAYAFGNADHLNHFDIRRRTAVIKLKDPTKGLSGRGPGYISPTGMDGIGDYEITYPLEGDPRWKPTDWLTEEADTNVLTELAGEGMRYVIRNSPLYVMAPEPSQPYVTTGTGTHLAPVGMGALAHLIGNQPKSWEYLGHHAANTCVNGPGNGFDGHASSNLSAFWSILGAARSNDPAKLRAYLDYQKTFLVLSETHNGGLIIQPWGRDRPNSNSDLAYGPRILTTATGAILLSLGQKNLRITGADSSPSLQDSFWPSISAQGKQVQIEFETMKNKVYRLEGSSNLTDWELLQQVDGVGGQIVLRRDAKGHYFFRVRSVSQE